ncbi:circadian locomoter output cycles protein kaput-like isoform X2 [Rhynchophorus ferrugineus]|uniref:circadian locomoter output cycles protein kaput-like isoform X2 n=1 Tax=Rhynchophorus ferrugineus TaxID=354439 RepID=UPI003FCE4CAD
MNNIVMVKISTSPEYVQMEMDQNQNYIEVPISIIPGSQPGCSKQVSSTTNSRSNTREARNKAEKQRRDKINSFISELHTLVPLVSKSAKRVDKISTLRLTAAHLRLYHTLAKAREVPQLDLPKHVDQFLLEQLICDALGGFLIILTSDGKIIFVSSTVENLLGHLQADLMGESLYSVTAEEDRDRLKTYLQCEGELGQSWRKYFSIRIKRAGPRSEPAVYECIKMMGIHKHLQPNNNGSSTTVATANNMIASTSSSPAPYNSEIFVFFAKIFRPEPQVAILQAATRDEYITRHLIDGRIINCDHRISLIAGYMIEEVTGHSGFMYMHREDVRWVMIALRQMYDKGESEGSSCYRLKSRNGEFIYLKTSGYLEIDDQGIVESFVCVNTLVGEDEGRLKIKEMRKRYAAMFSSSLANLCYDSSDDEICQARIMGCSPDSRMDITEDPILVQQAIHELMQNLPSPGMDDMAMASHTNNNQNSPTCGAKEIRRTVPSKNPHLKLKTNKRSASMSPDHIKRQRINSLDSDSSQMSPVSPSILAYSKGSPVNKIQKVEEEYSKKSSDIALHQQHHPA